MCSSPTNYLTPHKSIAYQLWSHVCHCLITTANSIHSWTKEGRAIRRLVSLVDPVTDLIAEFDRRLLLAEGNENLELVESTDE